MSVLRVKHVSKRFQMRRERRLFGQKLMRKHEAAQWFEALNDVSFEVGKGESVGVIGPNGAGKSTLLSIIAGVLHPTSGAVERYGRVGGLLELGSGFHSDLTGLENARLNAALLGMSHGEVERKLPSIIEFSELERFINEPLRAYSSGMIGRLGFSVAVHFEPDVMLLDEVLAVGDARFKDKCAEAMRRLAHSDVTFIFVSHDMEAVRRLCPRTIRLDGGRLVDDGPSGVVIEGYRKALLEGSEGGVSASALSEN